MRDKVDSLPVSLLLPKGGGYAVQTEFVSLYGFRPNHPDTFFLSPWEFTQWFVPVRLQEPGATGEASKLSKLTNSGRAKRKSGTKLVPGEDYIFDEYFVNIEKGYYRYPPAKKAFHGRAPLSYDNFRRTWCLQRRLRPMVPCAENTPLPSRKVSKETRAKIVSVYLRPWTLAKPMATTAVPFLVDFAVPVAPDDQLPEALCERTVVRPAWKKYLTAVLPHAEKGLRGFMLTTLAEG